MVPPSTPQKNSSCASSNNKNDSVFVSPVSTTKQKYPLSSSQKTKSVSSPPCTPVLGTSSFMSSTPSAGNSSKKGISQIPGEASQSMNMSFAESSFLSPELTPATKSKNKRAASLRDSEILEYDGMNTRALKKVKLLSLMSSTQRKSSPVIIRSITESSRNSSKTPSMIDDDKMTQEEDDDEEENSNLMVDSDASTEIASDIEKDFFNDWDNASSSSFKVDSKINSDSLMMTPVSKRQPISILEDNVIPKAGLPAARTLAGASNRRKNVNFEKQFVVIDKQGNEIVKNFRSGINPNKNLFEELSKCLKDDEKIRQSSTSETYEEELERKLISEAMDEDDDSDIEDELQNYFQRIRNKEGDHVANIEDDEAMIRNILKNDNDADSDDNEHIEEEERYLRKLLSKKRNPKSSKSNSPSNQGLNNSTGSSSNFGFTLSELSNMRNFKKISVFKDNEGQNEKKKK